MKFQVVQFPTRLAEAAADELALEVNQVAVCIFPQKGMKALGYTDETVLIMTVEKNGFWIREDKELEPGELEYIPDEI